MIEPEDEVLLREGAGGKVGFSILAAICRSILAIIERVEYLDKGGIS